MWQLEAADVFDLLPKLEECSFDACFCDPPYGLEFMGKEWDNLSQDWNEGDPATAGHPTGGLERWTIRRPRYHADIKAQLWHQRWAEAVLRILKPGGFLLAFGGTRTYHRLTCGLEDAGFEIRDCMMWLHGQGFPKSHDISKAIDKAAGAEREVLGKKIRGDVEKAKSSGVTMAAARANRGNKHIFGYGIQDITTPATDAAKTWDGYGTALKPAWEPVVVAMKPLEGTFAQNALEHGVAGINVDGARIGCMTLEEIARSGKSTKGMFELGQSDWKRNGRKPQGRWPANLILSHHPECVRRGTERIKSCGRPNCHGRIYSKQGIARSGHSPRKDHAEPDGLETVEEWDCHPDCPVGMLDRQSGVTKSGGGRGRRLRGILKFSGSNARPSHNTHWDYSPGIDPNMGTASRFFYCAKASKSERNAGCNGQPNTHPTVKPLKVCEYLAQLLLPPKRETPRRLLVPFAGSGSEMIGALMAGWDEVVGIENDAEYLPVAEARLTHWAAQLENGETQGTLF